MIHVVRALTFQRLMSLYTGSYNKIINSLRFIVKNDLLTRSDAFIHNLWSLIFNFFFIIKICTIGIFCCTFWKNSPLIISVCVALLVPELEPFISLVGSIFFSILGITIPAVVETISCWDGHLGRGKWRFWKNTTLVIFSLLALIFGSWISISDIIKLYK